MERTRKAWINAILFAVTLAVNTMGALGVINGLSQKEISDRYITLITPSPATFSIWSVIYILLLISVILMIIRKDDAYYQKAVDEISGLFRVSCVLNIVWIVTFSYVLVELSTLFILGFVITLALLNLKLLKIQEGKRWLLPATFGIYNGWLLVATVIPRIWRKALPEVIASRTRTWKQKLDQAVVDVDTITGGGFKRTLKKLKGKA